jgi:hypothetical protein
VKEEGLLHVAQRHLQISAAEVSGHSEVLLLITHLWSVLRLAKFQGPTTKSKHAFYTRGIFRGN